VRFLIVEDEAVTLQLLTAYFKAKGHTVTGVGDGVAALAAFTAAAPDLVLLDILMPRLDGWSVLTALRRQSRVPVIMLSVLDSADDVVQGLTLGADDYLRKPFQLRELEARIQAVLRRFQETAEARLLQAGPCQIDDRSKVVHLQGKALCLSPKEYELLRLLASEPGRVFSCKEIIAHLWSASPRADPNDVKQYIHLLRSKLEADPMHPQWIVTVKGFGYKLTPF
jgi:DNA-binding response OmpR family regulator